MQIESLDGNINWQAFPKPTKKLLKKEQYGLRCRYFEVLRETSNFVDPFVKCFIQKKLELSSELCNQVLQRFRFNKAKLRPAQVRLAYELVGGENWLKLIPACAAVEVCDTSYYCADDVFDESAGSKYSYIWGSALSAIAKLMIAEMAFLVKKTNFQEIVQTIAKLDIDIYQGFYLDLNMINNINEQYYFKKAYAYNYWEHILKIGAILGEADVKTVSKIAEIGKNIGIAYVIANDTCDFGKQKCSDFALGKRTLPILYALNNAQKKEKEILQSLIGRGVLSGDAIEQIRKIIVKCGAISYGKQKAAEYCGKAIKLLDEFPNSEAKELLKFSTTMTQKNKFYDILKKYDH